jgi:predicted permease
METPDAPLVDQALPVISTATQAVLQVLLLALAGAYLEWTGQLGRTKRSAISNTTYRILLPCLLFSSVSESLSAERLKTLWVLPFYAVLYLVIGTGLGFVTSRLVSRPDDDFGRPHVMLSIAVANFVYFPLILIPAVVLQGALHPAGTNLQAEVKKAAGFLGLFVIACNLYAFGFGSWILRSHARAGARAAATAAGRSSGDRSWQQRRRRRPRNGQRGRRAVGGHRQPQRRRRRRRRL